ncbi:MAG TPA: hypothetical protein PKD45_02365 [Flavobacteriales bacterium]|nr:hypothetical protein [Flavobacteriales bacterium]
MTRVCGKRFAAFVRWASPLATVLAVGQAAAQAPQGGSPWNWHQHGVPVAAWATTELGAMEADPSGEPLGGDQAAGGRIGIQRPLQIDLAEQGEWTTLVDGRRLCRYAITSPGARMISIQFSAFRPAEGAKLFVYDAGRTRFLGAYTADNETATGNFATAFLPGNSVVVEYQMPPAAPHADIRIEGITHAWKNLWARGEARDFNPGYQSAPCQVNVACPEANGWEQQVRSVVMFARPDGNTCNGTLVNNALQDGKPYVLIANHCYQPNESQWVFYFNYQSPTCVGDTGQTAQTIVGAVKRSGTYAGDYCLMELLQAPPAAFNPYYAGWDRTGAVPLSGASFHNPLSDVKKVGIFAQPATTASEPETGTPCWQVYWSTGLMEPASSGAPLFNQQKRLVGYQVDGIQNCGTATTVPSLSAKLSAVWSDGSTPATRLSDWLDPNSNTVELDGYDPNAGQQGVRVRAKVLLQGPFNPATMLMNASLNDAGLLPLEEPYTALGYVHRDGGGGELAVPAVFNITGNGRIVDWVVIEVRRANAPANVLATRAALIRRDGRIVDTDGTGDVLFANLQPGTYHLAIRHRNHLGIMTQQPVPLAAAASLVDMAGGAVPLRGGLAATVQVAGQRAMWAGDVTGNGVVAYTGAGNDRDAVLVAIGGMNALAVTTGYRAEDVNMDGLVKYMGAGNDRDPILAVVGGYPVALRAHYLP